MASSIVTESIMDPNLPISPSYFSEHSGEDILAFHHYSSKDIIYEQPYKKPKVLGGKYLKGELLGWGSYSHVKEVLDLETMCRRAVKIMRKKKLRGITNGEANVQREIKIMKRLKHKNVVNMIETFENLEKEKLYIVLEYCVGGLQEMLDKAPLHKLHVWQAHKYFVQLIDGLEYIHSQNIVHNDIKPGNLLLTTSGTVKITDFGVADELNRYELKDLCHSDQGSHAFQPPEIASLSHEYWSGFKVDIWAAGVTLFQMTTGKLPFEGDTIYKLFAAISACVFDIPKELSASLRDLLMKILKKDAEERLSIPEIRVHMWFKSRQVPPLPQQLVHFPPYVENEDTYRGTTVLPYLENYDHYGTFEDLEPPDDRGMSYSNIPNEDVQFDRSGHTDSTPLQDTSSQVPLQGNILFALPGCVDDTMNETFEK